MQRKRDQRCFVPPIFEQTAVLFCTPRGAIEQRTVVVSEPRKYGKIVRAGQHVHAVDLVKPKLVDRTTQVARANYFWPRLA
jgi:hypothetical protein